MGAPRRARPPRSRPGRGRPTTSGPFGSAQLHATCTHSSSSPASTAGRSSVCGRGRHPLPRTAGLLADLTGLSRGNLRARRGPFRGPARLLRSGADATRSPAPALGGHKQQATRRAPRNPRPPAIDADPRRRPPPHARRPTAPRRGDTMTHAYQGGEWYAPPELNVDDYLRHAVLSVLDAEDALRAAGVRPEHAPKLLDALRHAVARVNALNKALPRTTSDDRPGASVAPRRSH